MTEVSECSGSSYKSHLPSDWKVRLEGFVNKCFPEELVHGAECGAATRVQSAKQGGKGALGRDIVSLRFP